MLPSATRTRLPKLGRWRKVRKTNAPRWMKKSPNLKSSLGVAAIKRTVQMNLQNTMLLHIGRAVTSLFWTRCLESLRRLVKQRGGMWCDNEFERCMLGRTLFPTINGSTLASRICYDGVSTEKNYYVTLVDIAVIWFAEDVGEWNLWKIDSLHACRTLGVTQVVSMN